MKTYDPAFYRILKYGLWSYLHFWLNLDYHIEEPLPKGPKVLVVNHPTVWDAFPILTWGEKGFVHVTVEDQIWSYPLPRLLFSVANQIRLDTEPGKGRSAINDALFLLRKPGDHSILFSIEGGQTLPEKRPETRARRGAILLAMEAGCPIVPIGVHVPRRNILRKEFRYRYRGRCYTDVSWVPRIRTPYSVMVGKARHPLVELGRGADKDQYQAYADEILGEVYRLADLAKARRERA